MTSCQELQNPVSSDHWCFSSGGAFGNKKKQRKIPKLVKQCSPQASEIKNLRLKDVPEVMSFVTNLSLHSHNFIERGQSRKFKA